MIPTQNIKKRKMMKNNILALIIMLWSGATSAQTLYTLSQCKQMAADSSADMLVARHNIEAAEQQRKEAFTNYFPQVSATGSAFKSSSEMMKFDINTADVIPAELASANIIPPEMLAMIPEHISGGVMDGGAVAAVTAMQPIYAGGQIVNGNRLAKLGVEVSNLQWQLSKNQTELTTEQYYWQIVSLKEKLKTIETIHQLLLRLHTDVSTAEEAGVAIKNDLLQVQIKLNEIEKTRITVENGLTTTRRLLALHIGKPGEDIDVIMPDDDLSLSYDDTTAISHEDAVENVAQYRLMDANVKANELQKKMTTGKNMPSVAVGAAYTAMRMMETDNNFGMIFATASVPLSGWWGGSHATKRQAIALDNAITQRDNGRQLLIINMDNCLNTLNDSRRQLDIAAQTLEQSAENLRLNQDYYHAGTATMSDLLDAEQQHQNSLDAYTDAKIDYQMSLLKYKQSIGN